MSMVPTFIWACPVEVRAPPKARKPINAKNGDFFINIELATGNEQGWISDAVSNVRLKLISDAELELSVLAVETISLNWETVIKPDWAYWQVQSYPETNILGKSARRSPFRVWNFFGTETPGPWINKATIVKNRSPHPLDNRNRVLQRVPKKGAAADRIPIVIFWTYVAKLEAPKIIRATQVEAVINRNNILISPRVSHS